MISGINNNSFVAYQNNNFNIQNQNINSLKTANTFKNDSVNFTNIIQNTENPIPDQSEEPPEQKINFFDRADVRLGGMLIGTTFAGGAIGYGLGSIWGAKALGAGIGAGVGLVAPVAILGCILYSIGNHMH